jgi:hypothetical protein
MVRKWEWKLYLFIFFLYIYENYICIHISHILMFVLFFKELVWLRRKYSGHLAIMWHWVIWSKRRWRYFRISIPFLFL